MTWNRQCFEELRAEITACPQIKIVLQKVEIRWDPQNYHHPGVFLSASSGRHKVCFSLLYFIAAFHTSFLFYFYFYFLKTGGITGKLIKMILCSYYNRMAQASVSY